MRLIDNIFVYIAAQGYDVEDQQLLLHAFLDGTIGLSDDEIESFIL